LEHHVYRHFSRTFRTSIKAALTSAIGHRKRIKHSATHVVERGSICVTSSLTSFGRVTILLDLFLRVFHSHGKNLTAMDPYVLRDRAAALHVLPRQNDDYRGGWPLGYIGPQCPADAPVVCKRDSDEEPQGCCPQGQFCFTTISEVYCCPTGKLPSVQSV